MKWVFGLVTASVTREGLSKKVRDYRASLTETHPDFVIERSRPVFFNVFTELSADSDIAVRVDDSSKVCKSVIHSLFYPLALRWKRTCKKRAGRLLDGREWNQMPEVKD